jgi:hypothetical protein
MGVAGGELLIPTIVLLFAVDIGYSRVCVAHRIFESVGGT